MPDRLAPHARQSIHAWIALCFMSIMVMAIYIWWSPKLSCYFI